MDSKIRAPPYQFCEGYCGGFVNSVLQPDYKYSVRQWAKTVHLVLSPTQLNSTLTDRELLMLFLSV